MAFSRSLPVGNTGFNAEYWRIGEVKEHFGANCLEVELWGYANPTVRNDPDGVPATSRQEFIRDSEYVADMDRASIYDLLGARDGDFKGAGKV